MEHVISIEEVEALETVSLNDLEVELYYQVFLDNKKSSLETFLA